MDGPTTAAETLPGIDYILGESRDRYSLDDVELLERAYEYGRKAHETQKRKTPQHGSTRSASRATWAYSGPTGSRD